MLLTTCKKGIHHSIISCKFMLPANKNLCRPSAIRRIWFSSKLLSISYQLSSIYRFNLCHLFREYAIDSPITLLGSTSVMYSFSHASNSFITGNECSKRRSFLCSLVNLPYLATLRLLFPRYTTFQTGFDLGKHFVLVSDITLIIHSSDFYIKTIWFIFVLQYLTDRTVTNTFNINVEIIAINHMYFKKKY